MLQSLVVSQTCPVNFEPELYEDGPRQIQLYIFCHGWSAAQTAREEDLRAQSPTYSPSSPGGHSSLCRSRSCSPLRSPTVSPPSSPVISRSPPFQPDWVHCHFTLIQNGKQRGGGNITLNKYDFYSLAENPIPFIMDYMASYC